MSIQENIIRISSQKDLVEAMRKRTGDTLEIRSGENLIHVRGSYPGKIIVIDSAAKFTEGYIDVTLQGASRASFVLSYGNCKVQNQSEANILANMTVDVTDEGFATVDGVCDVNTYGNSEAIAFGKCNCTASGKSKLTITDQCTATANGSATVISSGYTQVMIGRKFFPFHSGKSYIFAGGRSLVYCENNYVVLNKNVVQLSGFATMVNPNESSDDICTYNNLIPNQEGQVTLQMIAEKGNSGKLFHIDYCETELCVGESVEKIPVLTEMERVRRMALIKIGNPIGDLSSYVLFNCEVNKDDLYYVRDGVEEKVLMAKKCKIVSQEPIVK